MNIRDEGIDRSGADYTPQEFCSALPRETGLRKTSQDRTPSEADPVKSRGFPGPKSWKSQRDFSGDSAMPRPDPAGRNFAGLRRRDFYEARPVKNKIRLIASTFYPSFHVPLYQLLYRGLIQLMRRRPFSAASCNRHMAYCAHVPAPGCRPITIRTNFKLTNHISSRCFPGGRKKLFSPRHAAISNAFLFSLRQGVLSRSIAQQRMSNFLATAIIAIFLRDGLPRKIL